MTLSLVDAIRINRTTWGWGSVIFTIDGSPNEGLVAADWEEQLEVRVVPSNVQDGPPLGMSAGRYQVGRFPIRMLTDSAVAFKGYLAKRGKAQGLGSYGSVVFSIAIQLSGLDAPDALPSTTVFSSCRIVGEKRVVEEGTGAVVTEFAVACLVIIQDGATLWNSLDLTGSPIAAFPGTDSVTIAGPAGTITPPGKWTLTKADKVFGWQICKANGSDGATVKPTGDELIVSEFLIEFFDPQDWVLFQPFRALYLKKALVGTAGAPTALALGIGHPELKAQGCSSVVVQKVSIFKNDGFGVWSGTVSFLQYRPATLTLGRPNAAIPDVGVARPIAKDALEARMQTILAQNQARAGQ